MLAENIKTVEKNIKEACARANRSASDVTLIAVSKTKPVKITFRNLLKKLTGFQRTFTGI